MFTLRTLLTLSSIPLFLTASEITLQQKITELHAQLTQAKPLTEKKCLATIREVFKNIPEEDVDNALTKIKQVAAAKKVPLRKFEIAYWINAHRWIKNWARQGEHWQSAARLYDGISSEKNKIESFTVHKNLEQSVVNQHAKIVQQLNAELAVLLSAIESPDTTLVDQNAAYIDPVMVPSFNTPGCVASRDFADMVRQGSIAQYQNSGNFGTF